MKRKFFALLAASAALTLGACSPNAATGGAKSDSEIVTAVFKKLSKSPFAIQGDIVSTSVYYAEEGDPIVEPNGNSSVKTVLGSNFYFTATTSLSYITGEPVEVTERYDKAENGAAIVYRLSPFTNEVEALYAQQGGQLVPFDAMFSNPFKRAADGFGLSKDKDKIVLVDGSYLEAAYVFNVVFGGQQFYNPLTKFEIGFDEEYNPTTLDIEFAYESPYNAFYDTYSGEFVDASTITVDPIPTPRAAQAGQDDLQAMFDSLQNLNYTVEFECSINVYEPVFDEETGEATMVKTGTNDSTVKTYLTPTGYFYEFGGALKEFEEESHTGQFADHGEVETAKGLVEFQRDNENGTYFATKTPKQIRTVEDKFGVYWQYCARAFDVNEDGTFTVGTDKGFDSYLYSNLMTDSAVYAMSWPFNIRLTLDKDKNELFYRYSDEDGWCQATIKNIGTTELPLDVSTIAPYTPPANWTEWASMSSHNMSQMGALDFITKDHRDAVPYVYTPYDYYKYTDGDIDYDFDMETFQLVEVIRDIYFIEAMYQFDTSAEAVAAYLDALAQVESAGFFEFDPVKDAFFWKDDDLGVNLKLEIYIVNDFNSGFNEEPFAYGLAVNVYNLNSNPTPIIY